MSALKVTQIGNSLGVILPKEVLARLKVEKGDVLYLSDAVNGVLISPYSPEFEQQKDAARSMMKKRGAVLRDLAT